MVIQERHGTALPTKLGKKSDRIMAVLQLKYRASWYFGVTTKDCLLQVKGTRSMSDIGCNED
jgi:hypothetical protein